MSATTLWAGSAFAAASAAIYIVVARKVWARDIGGEAQRALDLFGLWWVALAATTLIGALNTALAAAGFTSLPAFVAATHLSLLLICVALWGLLYYLLYLYTGRAGILTPLTLFYIAYYILLVYFVTASQPVGVQVRQWDARLEYASPQGGLFSAVVIALLVLPQILAALAYFLLFFRVEDRMQKYRISLVSASIVVWFGSALVASLFNLADSPTWNLASRAIGLTASLAILIAFAPPAGIKRWLTTPRPEVVPTG